MKGSNKIPGTMLQTSSEACFYFKHSFKLYFMLIIVVFGLCANSASAEEKHCVYGELLCGLFETTSLTSDWVDSYPEPVEPIDGLPIAFGDVNSDHLVDLLFVTDNGKSLQLLQGRNCVDGKTLLTYFGARNCLYKREDFQCSFGAPIVNVAISDFTGSNRPDFLVTLSLSNDRYSVYLVPGTANFPQNFNCNNSQLLLEGAKSEPLVLDYNGDMVSDFIVETEDCPTYVWIGGQDEQVKVHVEDFQLDWNIEEVKKYLAPQRRHSCLMNLTQQHISKPHSSAFVNLNKHSQDMTPDIFIDGNKYVEYIYNKPMQGFVDRVIYDFPEASLRGQSVFIDLDYNGRLEHVIPVCFSQKHDKFSLCTSIGLMALNHNTKAWENILDMGNQSNRSLTFTEIKTMMLLEIPVTMRVADLDYDGYPDLVTVMKDHSTGKTFGAVFMNVQQPENQRQNSFKRVFQLEWTTESIESDNVLMLTLFDTFNNGLLHLLVTTITPKGQFKTYSYDFFSELKKAVYYSFLRTSVVSGRCSDKAPHIESCPIPDSLAFGTGPPGVTACFNGPYRDQYSCSTQLSQSAHFALQLPYMVFGLGDVLNVIKDLRVSIANGVRDSSVGQWEENIPGSNLVVVPYPLNKPTKWEIRVFINMSIYSLISIAFLFVLGFFLLISIYFLHRIEMKEDKKEQKDFQDVFLLF